MKNKRISLVLLCLLLFLGIVYAAYYALSSEKVSARRVQSTLDSREKLIDKNIDIVSRLLKNDNIVFDKFVNSIDKDVLLYVFCDDSLAFWNNNLVDSRILKKRISIPADTVCNLFVGDFLVKSFVVHDYSVYALSMLGSTYSIENEYLVNEFRAPFFPNSNKVVLNPDDGKYPLYNSMGQVATRFDIITTGLGSLPYFYIVYFLIIVAIVVVSICLYDYLSRKRRFVESPFNFGQFTMLSLVFAFAAAVLTYSYNRQKTLDEERMMKQVALDLFDERDTVFESSFSAFSKSLATDTMLLNMVFSNNNMIDDVVSGYAENLLFDSVMKSYEVTMTVCVPGQEMIVDGSQAVLCDGYFSDVMALNNSTQVADNLFLIDYATLDPNYLGIVTLKINDTTTPRRLYFEFYKPVTPSGFGLPSILHNNADLIPSGFSVASYRNNMLNYKYGSYIYPNHLSDYNYTPNGYRYGRKTKNYSIVDDNKALVVNCERRGWMALTAPFSVFFLSMVIVCLLFLAIFKRKNKANEGRKSLRQKFQVAIMVTMLIAFGIVGSVSVFYMLERYEDQTNEFNFEQTRSILLDLRREISYARLNPDNSERGDFEMLLKELSNTFFVDLNLYGTDGRLIATSRPELFDYKLQAPLVNAQAYANLNDDKALYYTHKENVGKNKFRSDYIAVPGNNGETVAYLNIPYFSSDGSIRKDVVNFALAYVNIILLLVGVSAIVVMLVMRRITKPLVLIQKKMGEVKIDRVNEPIELKSNDEIGELVEQYNKLVGELEESANIIARSERQTAWREMARQVAHEIKNPLTPMRLSIQFLQRAWDEQSPDIEQKFKRTTSTLIEQIDALSEIASAFSNYAKLPEGNPEPLDLKQLLSKCINLYDNEENIKFSFECSDDKAYEFTADPNNLSRAFGNIIKNAIQAIGKTKPDGRIDVKLLSLSRKYVVTITDNGKGIREEDKAKIFMPNFTTKSSGMGIGLSIVHNIIQAANGRITFDSTENVGTTFTVELFKN